MTTRVSNLSEAGRRHALLTARARRLARLRKTEAAVKTISCLICEAAGELYALPLLKIAKVSPSVRLASVPASNPALVGITSRAGVFFHVYDLARLVGGGAGKDGHLVMMRGSPALALRVDAALRVAEIVMLGAEESESLRARHFAVAGFARAENEELFEGRTISLIEPDKLAPAHATGRVEGDQA
jgi:chemotaxis signal transduction protein